jgi:hypothetical protein
MCATIFLDREASMRIEGAEPTPPADQADDRERRTGQQGSPAANLPWCR